MDLKTVRRLQCLANNQVENNSVGAVSKICKSSNLKSNISMKAVAVVDAPMLYGTMNASEKISTVTRDSACDRKKSSDEPSYPASGESSCSSSHHHRRRHHHHHHRHHHRHRSRHSRSHNHSNNPNNDEASAAPANSITWTARNTNDGSSGNRCLFGNVKVNIAKVFQHSKSIQHYHQEVETLTSVASSIMMVMFDDDSRKGSSKLDDEDDDERRERENILRGMPNSQTETLSYNTNNEQQGLDKYGSPSLGYVDVSGTLFTLPVVTTTRPPPEITPQSDKYVISIKQMPTVPALSPVNSKVEHKKNLVDSSPPLSMESLMQKTPTLLASGNNIDQRCSSGGETYRRNSTLVCSRELPNHTLKSKMAVPPLPDTQRDTSSASSSTPSDAINSICSDVIFDNNTTAVSSSKCTDETASLSSLPEDFTVLDSTSALMQSNDETSVSVSVDVTHNSGSDSYGDTLSDSSKSNPSNTNERFDRRQCPPLQERQYRPKNVISSTLLPRSKSCNIKPGIKETVKETNDLTMDSGGKVHIVTMPFSYPDCQPQCTHGISSPSDQVFARRVAELAWLQNETVISEKRQQHRLIKGGRTHFSTTSLHSSFTSKRR